MTNLDLGRLGLGLNFHEGADFLHAVAEAELMGYSTVWLAGGPLPDLDAVATVLRATGSINVATSILSVDRFSAQQTSAFFTAMERETPGRLVAGLGGAHGESPLTTMNSFLDDLDDTVPVDRRVLAALGPKMLELARNRAAGALPVLVTPEYTASARAALGSDAVLAVQQLALIDPDASQAREVARQTVGFLVSNPAYAANARRMGFDDADVEQVSDRLVDALVPSGDAATVVAAIQEQYAAGADHVAVNLLNPGVPVQVWREVANEL